jgi:L-amino acid N-acyltransferase YncA
MPTIRRAPPADLDVVAAIDNEGIEDRMATFETPPRAPEQRLLGEAAR